MTINLNASNVNVSNTSGLNVSTVITVSNNITLSFDKIIAGNVYINPTRISVGQSSINSSVINVPTLTLGGISFNGSTPIPYTGTGGIMNTQFFTAGSSTWINPKCDPCNPIKNCLSGNEQVFVMVWGSGGLGDGGGGACALGSFKLNELSNQSITVASAGQNVNSSFNNKLIAGSGGSYNGGGGGLFASAVGCAASNGGGPLGGTTSFANSTLGGGRGYANSTNGGSSIFGGGGASGTCGTGGSSIFGGPGFGCFNGKSVASPLCGAGSSRGDGQIRVWVIK